MNSSVYILIYLLKSNNDDLCSIYTFQIKGINWKFIYLWKYILFNWKYKQVWTQKYKPRIAFVS